MSRKNYQKDEGCVCNNFLSMYWICQKVRRVKQVSLSHLNSSNLTSKLPKIILQTLQSCVCWLSWWCHWARGFCEPVNAEKSWHIQALLHGFPSTWVDRGSLGRDKNSYTCGTASSFTWTITVQTSRCPAKNTSLFQTFKLFEKEWKWFIV